MEHAKGLLSINLANLVSSLCNVRWHSASRRPAAGANTLAEAVGLSMADWWELTVRGYLNHVPKAQTVQALEDAGVDLADDRLAAM